MRQSRAAAHRVFDGPMRANFGAIILDVMGPCERLHTITFKPEFIGEVSPMHH
jgi:hypothetical protein